MPHILIVGSINMDLVVRVSHIPAPGETIIGSNWQAFPGGKGANQAVAAARLGANVTMIAKVGADEFGKTLQDNLAAVGVDTTHININPQVGSGIAMIAVDDTGQNSIVVSSGANATLTAEDVQQTWSTLTAVDVVIVQLETPLPTVIETARLAQASGVPVILNPAPAQPLPKSLLASIHTLIPNESETALLTNLSVNTLEQAKTAAKTLLTQGPQQIIITLGERGAMLLTKDEQFFQIQPHPVNVVDTTGAGDAFVAATAVALAEGLSPTDMLALANAAGAVAVTRAGAQVAMPTRSEVNVMISQK